MHPQDPASRGESRDPRATIAYFGDRDRPFRRIVTAAQRAVLRVEILMHAVTMERFFRARQHQFGASPNAGMTVAARVLPAVTVRDFSAPATCYAGSERPGSAKSGRSHAVT
jgi:hypothetical protein